MSQRSLFLTTVYGWVCDTCGFRFYAEEPTACPSCGADTRQEAA